MPQEDNEPTQIITHTIEHRFKNCPKCGYEDGFHSMFEYTKDRTAFAWRFICPDCSTVFDVGFRLPVSLVLDEKLTD